MRLATETLAAPDPPSVKDACEALGLSRATLARRRKADRDRAAGIEPPTPRERHIPREIPRSERDEIFKTLCSPEFVDATPARVYATLLARGEYLCSIRAMYRILHENKAVRDRRNQRSHPTRAKPRVRADGPNQVWTWDITKLPGPVKGVMYCLYVVMDLYSRRVVGWKIADTENNLHARSLFGHAAGTQGIVPGQVTVHSDNGAPMTSHGLAGLFQTLGISTSFSRPRVSNDNPFSEALFKTSKYHRDYPGWFASLAAAEAYFEPFFDGYNHEHHHSGIGLFTPDQVHSGEHERVQEVRQAALDEGHRRHPERFVRGRPRPPQVPAIVAINPEPGLRVQPETTPAAVPA